jgi:outer membrane biosynthesis protein TonB
MTKTKMFLVRHKGAMVIGLLILVALLVVGCGGEPTVAPTEVAAKPVEPTAAPTEPPPTDEPTEPPPTAAPTEPPPTDEPTDPPPTPTLEPTDPPPTATPTEEPTPEPIDDTACIVCHTDEATLKALAVEPEETESLSEGEG